MIHKTKASSNLAMGEKENGKKLADVGILLDFVNSFKASAIGWGNPIILTLLGPLRVWEYPKIFRSKRVKNAMAANARINDDKIEM